jgi:hypothetical protein
VVALLPIAVVLLEPVAKRGYQWFFFHVGQPGLGVLDQDRGVAGASAFASFYGPLGVVLLLLGAVAPVLVARRGLPWLWAVLAAAPLIVLVVVVATIGYTHDGRYFMYPVALACAAMGLLFRERPVAWALVGIAVATVALTMHANDEKPPQSFAEPRWQVLTRVAGERNGEKAVIRFVEENVPRHDSIGLALRSHDWSYPFFGSSLTRAVRFVPAAAARPDQLDWLVVAPQTGRPGPRWRKALHTPDGWSVFSAASA